jgi:type IV pilus assembly protein PilA
MAMCRDKKGFSLIELLIVLVIIALLIALLIPYVIDTINDAKTKAEIAETRNIVVALQTVLSLSYDDKIEREFLDRTDIYNLVLTKRGKREIKDLLGIEYGKISHIKASSSNKLTGFHYVTVRGSTVIFEKDKLSMKELY